MAYEQYPYTNFHDLNLDWVLKTLKDLKSQWEETLSKLSGYDFEQLKARVDALEETIANIEQEVIDAAEAQIPNIIAKYINTAIYTGLTDEGYITFYKPDSWADVTFKTTGLDIFLDTQPEFGHLVVQY